MIDLTGHPTLLLSTEFDALASTIKLTIKDGSGATTLGQVLMDQARFRPFIYVLQTMASVYYDTLSTLPQNYSMNFDVNKNSASVAFR